MVLQARLKPSFKLAAALSLAFFPIYLATIMLASMGGDGAVAWRSERPYYNYLGEAFLNGHFHFVSRPPSLQDLSPYRGSLYLHSPPLAGLLMAPLVALQGTGASDKLLTAAFGALNVGLVYLLLAALDGACLVKAGPRMRKILSVFFGLGTVHFYMSCVGRVWFTAQVTALTMALLFLIMAVLDRPFLAGLFSGLAFLGRYDLVGALPFVLIWLDGRSWKKFLGSLSRFLVLPLSCLAFLLWYNYSRFGNILETGIRFHLMAPMFQRDFGTYGCFSLHYLPRNLYAFLARPFGLSARFPFIQFDDIGMSLFITSPLFLYCFKAMRDGRAHKRLAILCLVCILLVAPSFLLIMGTGQSQFGHRYSLDLYPFLIVLLAMGLEDRMSPLKWALWAWSLAMNALGTAWFLRT